MDDAPLMPQNEATLLGNLLGSDWPRQLQPLRSLTIEEVLDYVEAQRPDLEWDDVLRATVAHALYDVWDTDPTLW